MLRCRLCAKAAQKPHFYLGRKWLILLALKSPFWLPRKSPIWNATPSSTNTKGAAYPAILFLSLRHRRVGSDEQ